MANAAHTRPAPKPVEYASLPEGRALVFKSNRHKHVFALKHQIITTATPQEQAIWRYAHDRLQRRVLSQQGATRQADLITGAHRSQFHEGSHRLHLNAQPTTYNTNGQPERVGQREYVWDALGRLVEVREEARPLAQYRYDHRGLRIGKTVMSVRAEPVEALTTITLHDESRQPLAELDAQGRITRQYVWLADMPLAVIDTPASLALAEPGIQQVFKDIATALQSWFEDLEGIAWLHTNHLGAPEAATNAQGHVIWRARYTPFGAAHIESVRPEPVEGLTHAAFTLHLRLPGQLFDEETGLHHNRQRYYDPEHGQYLTPDPLGTPDGPNPYAYVAFNPLSFIDPDGLVLFAFDGTLNSNVRRQYEALASVPTNIDLFQRYYQDGERLYVSGVGTRHIENSRTNYLGVPYTDILARGFGPGPDTGGNFTGRERIDRMWSYLIDEAETTENETVMQIDIVGFSRGAAQAREFANRVAAIETQRNGVSTIQYQAVDRATGQRVTRCQRVNLRFMGLFDTVLSTDLGGGPNYRLSIPPGFEYVAHATALNEHRSQPYGWDILGYPFNAAFWDSTRLNLADNLHQGGFPLESIGGNSNTAGQVRIERGFIGAHADIGGGYREGNDISLVALSWMVAQARAAGLTMSNPPEVVASGNASFHDQSNALRIGDPRTSPVVTRELRDSEGMSYTQQERLIAEDRQVRGAVTGNTQRTMGFDNNSLTTAGTYEFITYNPRTVGSYTGVNSTITGTVDMRRYLQWLRDHGYCFADDACDDLPTQ
jgi:RHS repeat-associated protein